MYNKRKAEVNIAKKDEDLINLKLNQQAELLPLSNPKRVRKKLSSLGMKVNTLSCHLNTQAFLPTLEA